MAGNGEVEAVRRAGARDRADGLRRTNELGDARIGGSLAWRNASHLLPDALLERSAAQVEREIEHVVRRGNESPDCREVRPYRVAIAQQVRFFEALAQLRDELRDTVCAENRHNSFIA